VLDDDAVNRPSAESADPAVSEVGAGDTLTSEPFPVAGGGPSRTKTIAWHDPLALAAAGRSLSGLEFLRKISSGELPAPPIAELFGFSVDSVGPGDVVFRCAPDESTYNPIGVVHGGMACVLLDTVAGCAVHTTLAAGVGYTSLEIKVNYLRPIHGGTALIAHGWVTKPGRRAAFAEGDIRDANGTLLATASSTCLVMGG
jgi:uncharacterized protein (TIGR00369 family)